MHFDPYSRLFSELGPVVLAMFLEILGHPFSTETGVPKSQIVAMAAKVK
jgi:hypothetical protein